MLDNDQLKKISGKFDKLITNVTKSSGRKQPKVPGVVVGLTNEKSTVYYDFKGVLDLKTKEPVTKDTVFCYYSCTKAITALGLLTLVDQGKVNFDDEVRKFLPDIEKIWIVDKGTVDEKTGEFLKPPREPKTKVTIKHLLTQTAGFSYPFLNQEYGYLAFKKNPNLHSGNPTKELFSIDKMPLISEPGARFTYGHSIDWVGLVIENITGEKLGEYLKRAVFDKIGMKSCTFHMKTTENLIIVQRRTRSGELVNYSKSLILDPKIDMGGQGCFGTVEDYLKFIRMWLNYGFSPDSQVQIVNSDLAKYALKNHLPDGMTVTLDIPGLPDLPDGFSFCGMAVTGEDIATGRPKGTLYWSGLANLYYWIDFDNQIGGFWGSQVLPMADPQSLLGYFRMESAVYDVINGEDDNDDEDEDDEDEDDNDQSSKL
ncbi:putative ML-236A carboxylate methylbutanoyltransferase Mlchp [[Candida] jaroonii]|uniref:ML-236A carboxylate methylbutanoyltransferase Mlchp n=1 Tax=[Candida] jaroonii TaxID=467808 RepID=A0ACA9Y9R5_9ASCO|nr:putative ML-236A carboxylate methylbutanoyltransferase Mlchp [[Candida] jaroonii]